jgi:hypothetical protein
MSQRKEDKNPSASHLGFYSYTWEKVGLERAAQPKKRGKKYSNI